MNLGVAFVVATILVTMSPVIWVAWWLLAYLGKVAANRPAVTGRDIPIRRHVPAA